MPIAEDQLEELKHAYQVLGLGASAPSIKHAYRRIAKRWHPDLYPAGTPSYAEATHMMKLINEAYARIDKAPLRYHVESGPPPRKEPVATARTWTPAPPPMRTEPLPRADRIEFWARFVWGAFLGILFCFRLWMEFFDLPSIILVSASIAVIVGLGLTAARLGDRFWHSLLRHWWLWE